MHSANVNIFYYIYFDTESKKWHAQNADPIFYNWYTFSFYPIGIPRLQKHDESSFFSGVNCKQTPLKKNIAHELRAHAAQRRGYVTQIKRAHTVRD